MNIVIAGDGKVGKSLASRLSLEGHDITIIDKDADVLENSIEQYDVMSIVGNCASMEVLKEAGIQDADLLLTMTNHDEVNLLCCMIAHHLNPRLHTIARVRSIDFDHTIDVMQDAFALSLAVNPDKHAAHEIRHILRYPGFLRRDRFVDGQVQIVELEVTSDSRLLGQPLYMLEKITKCKVLVCVIVRKDQPIIPKGNVILEEGDHIYMTSVGSQMTQLLYNLGIIHRRIKDVLIIGGSRIAVYLTELLLKDGLYVKIIEQDYERCLELSEALDATIIHADAGEKEVLIKEGVEEFDALINLTGNDELNILLGIYGESLNLPKVVTKLGNAENFAVLSKLEIGTVVNPKELCSNTIVRFVRALNNQHGSAVTIHTIADGKVEAIEFIVDEHTKHQNTPLSEIKIKDDVLIASITNGTDVILPNGKSTFSAGDRLVVVTNRKNIINNVNDIFKD